MKKIIGVLIIGVLLFTGCSSIVTQNNNDDLKKQSKIEVYSAEDDKLLITIDDQDTVNKLLETYNWESIENLSNDLLPEYKLVVYQEKTLLFGQDPDKERGYELIETMVTFKNSPYIKEVISSDVIKNMIIPDDALSSCYVMPDEIIEKLHEQLSK